VHVECEGCEDRIKEGVEVVIGEEEEEGEDLSRVMERVLKNHLLKIILF
jgi:hypothetical protein